MTHITFYSTCDHYDLSIENVCTHRLPDRHEISQRIVVLLNSMFCRHAFGRNILRSSRVKIASQPGDLQALSTKLTKKMEKYHEYEF